MAIAFACTCGKKLKTRDEFAGRKIKCPACQEIVTIPSGTLSPVSSPSALETTAPWTPEAAADVPLAKPAEVQIRDATPRARRVAQERPRPPRYAVSASTPYPWVDRSLEQSATPWLGDDGERFAQEIKERGGPGLLVSLIVLALLAGVVAVVLLA